MQLIDPKRAAAIIQAFFKDFDWFPAADMPPAKEAAHHLKLTAAVLVGEIQEGDTPATITSMGHLQNAARLRHESMQKEAARGTHPTV